MRGDTQSELGEKAMIIGRRASTQNRLEERKKRLEEELKAINAAIELFKTHPQIADALDLLGQINL